MQLIQEYEYDGSHHTYTQGDMSRAAEVHRQRIAELNAWATRGWRLVDSIKTEGDGYVLIADTFERKSLPPLNVRH